MRTLNGIVMQNKKCCTKLISIISGLLLSMVAGVTYSDEISPCSASCALDLKQCRREADSFAVTEGHPLISDEKSIQNRAFINGQNVPLVDPTNSPNIEIEKRKNERYQQCETENKNCLRQCMTGQETEPAPITAKKSVILK
jgi:hypothetical protein